MDPSYVRAALNIECSNYDDLSDKQKEDIMNHAGMGGQALPQLAPVALDPRLEPLNKWEQLTISNIFEMPPTSGRLMVAPPTNSQPNWHAIEAKMGKEQRMSIAKQEQREAPKKAAKETGPYDCSARRFQITIFDKWEDGLYNKVLDYLIGRTQCSYIISCWEICPDTKNEHWHIFCHFNNSVKLSKKKCFNSHLEVVRGSVQDNIDYIRKTGKHKSEWNDNIDNHINLIEWGEVPKEHGGGITGYELTHMSEAEVINYDPRCHQAYLKARELLLHPADLDIDDWSKVIKVYYIQGPSGIGKTNKAKDIIRSTYPAGERSFNMLKFENTFWSGIGTAKIAIYDDWRSSHMKASEWINFIDYNKHNLNVKGGHRRNNYELIIITSIERFDEIYRNMTGEPRLQWERRVELIDMYNDLTLD